MKTILLIDDNEMIRENTAEILALSNYNVLTAENGRKGLELAISKQPDLILCDVMMPEMNGLDLLKKIRETEHINKTPVILLTARAERTDINKGLEYGADEYLAKPYEGDQLLRIIAKKLHNVAHL